ncbi:MAG TPA: serine/threonine-protein kinase, partial [Gemmataceae bacterium]|nr:serine/threonine-protein kinase [Gemmataceae bacterium]
MNESRPTDRLTSPEPAAGQGSPDPYTTVPPTTAPAISDTVPTSDPATPSSVPLLPGYHVLAELGRGGMGVVYKARQVALDRVVALKMVLDGEYASPDARRRFRAEAEAVARLQHPHIVQIFDVGEKDGRVYFSLEYCPGGTLAGKLNGSPLPPREAARLVETLARAVHAAHEQHLVHRDLKPANVLLTADGTPKIADFGLARRTDREGETQTGAVIGTPSYMAPEQAAGRARDVTPATDVYALGAILYEALTGRPPFRGSTLMETLDQVRFTQPAPPRRLRPDTPRDLEAICLRCLAKRPADRYPTAAALADDLRRFVEGGRVPPARPRRRRLIAVAAAAAALLGLAVVGFLAWQAWADSGPEPFNPAGWKPEVVTPVAPAPAPVVVAAPAPAVAAAP